MQSPTSWWTFKRPQDVSGSCRMQRSSWIATVSSVAHCGRRYRCGVRPPPANVVEPGEWPHGWQYYASSASEHHFRRTVMNHTFAADQAHVRSHSGPGSSPVLSGCPTKPEFRVEPQHFRTVVLERTRRPLHVAEATSVARSWTSRGATARRVTVHGDCAPRPRQQSGQWPGCAGRLEQHSVSPSS